MTRVESLSPICWYWTFLSFGIGFAEKNLFLINVFRVELDLFCLTWTIVVSMQWSVNVNQSQVCLKEDIINTLTTLYDNNGKILKLLCQESRCWFYWWGWKGKGRRRWCVCSTYWVRRPIQLQIVLLKDWKKKSGKWSLLFESTHYFRRIGCCYLLSFSLTRSK
jgi:hypothetical protein